VRAEIVNVFLVKSGCVEGRKRKRDEDLREQADEENYHDDEEWDLIHKNYFLAYHQAKVHAHWCATRPEEAEHFNRFRVRACV